MVVLSSAYCESSSLSFPYIFVVFLHHRPPGTGKTHTICTYISIAVRILPARTQILVIASSNTAVDNMVKGLMKLKVDVVRIGQSNKVGRKQNVL